MSVPAAPAGLYVEELAPAAGGGAPLVVLVHGSMDRHRSFLRLCLRLRDCHVVVYDRRGYNRSRDAGPPAAGVADHAADLISVLAGRQAVVLGHSYGGDVALAAAAARPDLVRSLVVYEAPLGWLEWWHPESAPRRNMFEGVDPGDAAEAFIRRIVGKRRYDRLPARAREERRGDGPALVAEITALRAGPAPFDPSAIEVPVVVSNGSLSAERHQRGSTWLMERLPEAEHAVIDGADHVAHLTHPDELAGLVRRAVDLAGRRRP